MTTPSPKPSDLGFTDDVLGIFFPADAAKSAQEETAPASDRPIGLLRTVTAKLGPHWISWEPETLWSELKRTWKDKLPDVLKDKIQAAKSLLVTNAFWRDHLAFEKIVMAFNNHVPLFDQYQQPSPAMIANAIEEAAKIRKAPFSEEVLRYVAAIAYEDGLVVLPEPLDIAQGHLDELCRPVVGQHLKDDIRRRWEESKGAPEGMYAETPTGVHLAKMAAIQEYVRSF